MELNKVIELEREMKKCEGLMHLRNDEYVSICSKDLESIQMALKDLEKFERKEIRGRHTAKTEMRIEKSIQDLSAAMSEFMRMCIEFMTMQTTYNLQCMCVDNENTERYKGKDAQEALEKAQESMVSFMDRVMPVISGDFDAAEAIKKAAEKNGDKVKVYRATKEDVAELLKELMK